MSGKVRVDKWLWAARFFKTRAVARDAIKGGKVQMDGVRVKPGKVLSLGDQLEIRRGEDVYRITVDDLGDRRVSASLASEKYTEDPESIRQREAAAEKRRLDYQAHADRVRRPDKRQRRQIVKFTKSGR